MSATSSTEDGRARSSSGTLVTVADGADRANRCLVVFCGGAVQTHDLPDKGSLLVGRARDCDIRIDHASVSRHHARLHVDPAAGGATGAAFRVEDLGSAHGVSIDGARITAGATVEISAGDAIDIGAAMAIVQERPARLRRRRIWSHGEFEARVDEECARAGRVGRPFALVRIDAGQIEAETIETAIIASVRGEDVVSAFGPGRYHVLLVDADAELAGEVGDRLRAALRGAAEVRIGAAVYARNGRDPDSLLEAAARATLRAPVAEVPPAPAPAMRQLARVVEKIAGANISVLILGETGVGKGVLARRIHELSPRAFGPFVELNCAALPETLLESELFGHEKGAFTGAVAVKPGLLETADGGTVFLDEIGELPLSTQVKLLRVLEQRRVLRVGGIKHRNIDVRFLAATNRDLEAEMGRERFRRDLYFRLNGVSLLVPPLRQRRDEIAPLARGFAEQAAQRAGLASPPAITPEAMGLIAGYSWPGNIRELRNAIERAVILSTDGTIGAAELPLEKLGAGRADVHEEPPPEPPRPVPKLAELRAEAERRERDAIAEALARCAGNQTRAAAMLGITRRQLLGLLDQYEVARPRKRRGRS